MEFKDLFSGHAQDYAKYRPTYPDALFQYLASLTPAHDLVWDCGTGNAQAALKLTEYFRKVIATDPSERQIQNATPHPKIEYRVESSEETTLETRCADLITVAQAFHWFKHECFYEEVKRVLKPHGVLAVWAYAWSHVTPEVDAVVDRLYGEILGPYWEQERRLVEDGYRSIAIPFEEIAPPKFEMSAQWTLEHLVGYLTTWSALQSYMKKNQKNPIEDIFADLKKAWGGEFERKVTWELNIRVGRF